jgi:hypothetical protein
VGLPYRVAVGFLHPIASHQHTLSGGGKSRDGCVDFQRVSVEVTPFSEGMEGVDQIHTYPSFNRGYMWVEGVTSVVAPKGYSLSE